jgi:hypothetical protein
LSERDWRKPSSYKGKEYRQIVATEMTNMYEELKREFADNNVGAIILQGKFLK